MEYRINAGRNIGQTLELWLSIKEKCEFRTAFCCDNPDSLNNACELDTCPKIIRGN